MPKSNHDDDRQPVMLLKTTAKSPIAQDTLRCLRFSAAWKLLKM